jgi:hypothetical protein
MGPGEANSDTSFIGENVLHRGRDTLDRSARVRQQRRAVGMRAATVFQKKKKTLSETMDDGRWTIPAQFHRLSSIVYRRELIEMSGALDLKAQTGIQSINASRDRQCR